MTSREYFEGASDAQRRMDACIEKLAALRSREQPRSRLPEASAGNRAGDPMRATDERIDAEAEAASEMAACEAEVADARTVCRGIRDANRSHPLWGDCVELHFLYLMRWRDVGSALGISGETARRAAYAALDWVDMVGIAAARCGRGGA